MNEIELQKERFREADQKRQQRIDELKASDDLLDMREEIATLKVLIAEAREAGQTSIVEKLTACLNRLIKDERSVQIANSELVSKSVMRRWQGKVEQLIEDTFKHADFDGWELVLRCFKRDMQRLLEESVNDDDETLRKLL